MGVTLREKDREYYYAALDKYFAKLKEKYIKYYGNSYEVSSFKQKDFLKIMNNWIYSKWCENSHHFMNIFFQYE